MANEAAEPLLAPWSAPLEEARAAEVEELLRQAELCLEGTVRIGVGADQRSAALCGVFGAGGFGLLTVAATIFAGSHVSMPLQLATGSAGIVLLRAAHLCAQAARPRDFYGEGYEPARLAAAAADKLWMQRYAIVDIQRRIEANRAEILREAELISRALNHAPVALVVGAAAFVVAFLAGR